MTFKGLLFVCAQALLTQCVFGQVGYNLLSTGSPQSYVSGNVVENNVVVNSGASSLGSVGLGASGVAAGLANNAAVLASSPPYINLGAISGGGVLPVSSYSPIAPGGLRVFSDNAIDGSLLVSGELPFLSAVAFEGGLATGGSGVASCGCGDGSVGIVSESIGAGRGLGLGGLGLGAGLGAGLGVNSLTGLGGVPGIGRGGLVF